MTARSDSAVPVRRVWLVLALLAGLVAMHGLSDGPAAAASLSAAAATAGVAVAPSPHTARAGVMKADHGGSLPGSPMHHGPTVEGQHLCLAVVAVVTPVLAGPPGRFHPRDVASLLAFRTGPGGASTDRAPPDLHELCVSRT